MAKRPRRSSKRATKKSAARGVRRPAKRADAPQAAAQAPPKLKRPTATAASRSARRVAKQTGKSKAAQAPLKSTRAAPQPTSDAPAPNPGKWRKGIPTPNPYGRGGRPKSAAADNPATKALNQPVQATIGGKAIKITARYAAALKLADAAVKGDNKALRQLLKWEDDSKKYNEAETGRAAQYPLEADDLRVIDIVRARILAAGEPHDR